MQNVKVILVNQTIDAKVGSSLFRLLLLTVLKQQAAFFFVHDEDLVSSTASSETPFQEGHGLLSDFAQSFHNSTARTNPFS